MRFVSWKKDLYRYTRKTDCMSFIKAYVMIPGFRYTFWFRKASCVRTKKSPIYLFYRYMLMRCSYKFGIDIPCSTLIGEGFYISHFSGIIVNGKTIIGKNVDLSHCVTIGQADRGSRKGVAVIGDNVYIGPGAKIIGQVRIGNNVAIGANAVVTKDIPDNSVAVGIPAKVISQKGTSGYLVNKV